jgi:NAD(P)H dehydrogenase (quinone)
MYAFFDGLGIPRAPIDRNIVAGVPWCSDDMVSFERAIRHGEMAVLSDDFAALTGRPPRSLASVVRERLADLVPFAGEMAR